MLITFIFCVFCVTKLSTFKQIGLNWYGLKFGFKCKWNSYLLINQAKQSYSYLHPYMMKSKYRRVYEQRSHKEEKAQANAQVVGYGSFRRVVWVIGSYYSSQQKGLHRFGDLLRTETTTKKEFCLVYFSFFFFKLINCNFKACQLRFTHKGGLFLSKTQRHPATEKNGQLAALCDVPATPPKSTFYILLAVFYRNDNRDISFQIYFSKVLQIRHKVWLNPALQDGSLF